MFKVVARALLYAALAAPLIIIPWTYFPFITGKAIFFRITVELALLFYALHLVFADAEIRREEFERFKKIFLHPVSAAIAAFAAVFVLTTLTAANPQLAFWSNFERAEGGFQMLHYFAFFSLAALLFNTKEDWKKISLYFSGIALLISIYAFVQLAAENNIVKLPFVVGAAPNPGSTLGNPSYLAAYLLMTLFFAFFAMTSLRDKRRKFIFALIPIAMLGGIVISQNRGVFVALILGALATLVALRSRRAVIVALLIIAAAAVIFLVAPTDWRNAVPVLSRLAPQNLIDASLRARFWVWSSAVAAIIERPLFGWGAENFPLAFDKYYNANHYGIESWFDRSHNAFLDYAIIGGLFLLAAYVSIFIFAFRKALKSRDAQLKAAALWLFMYLAQSMVLFDVLAVYVPLFALLAFFVAAENGFETLPSETRRYQPTASALANAAALNALTIMLIFYGSYLPYQKNTLLFRATREPLRDIAETISRFNAAFSLRSPVGQQETAEAFFFFWNSFLVNAASQKTALTEEAANAISQSVGAVFEANRASFITTRPAYSLGIINLQLAALSGNGKYIDEAGKYCKQGNVAAPTRIEFLECLYRVADAKGDAAEQKRLLATMSFLRPDLFSKN